MQNIGRNTLFQSFQMYISSATNVLNKTVTQRRRYECIHCSRKLVHGAFSLCTRRYNNCYNPGNALFIITIIIVETRKLPTNRPHLR